MDFHLEAQLKQGIDPRRFADFAALKAEMDKLHHPARPNIDWQYAEQLCLSMLKQNGVELQVAVWFCLSRAQLAGLRGVAESLPLVHALVVRQWTAFWPQQLSLRLHLLTLLGQQLVQCLRGCQWAQIDVSNLNKTGQLLQDMCSQLVQMELTPPEQLEHLRSFINSAAKRMAQHAQHDTKQLPAFSTLHSQPESTSEQVLVYVVPCNKGKSWHIKSLLSGALLGGVMIAVALLGVHWFEHKNLQLDAIPDAELAAWRLGMNRLDTLSNKLNTLDERRGEYMTISQLKTEVFNIREAFKLWIPLEEKLYRLEEHAENMTVTPAMLQQTDIHLKQLVSRYALIKQK